MPTPANFHPARRAGCTLYEIDPRSGATVEIFYADSAVAQSFGARGAGFLLAKARLLARRAEWSVHRLLRRVPGRNPICGSVAATQTGTIPAACLFVIDRYRPATVTPQNLPKPAGGAAYTLLKLLICRGAP
jgi:hypothetical protein